MSYGASRPYDMLKRQIRHFCGIRESDPPAVIHERLKLFVDRYPPALHDVMHRVFGTLLGETLPDARSADPEDFRRELMSTILDIADYQARLGPSVYVIDDVHWADVASLEALRNLLSLVRTKPVLFLFAMRPDWSSLGWQLYIEAQLTYPEYCASIYLEPLSSSESHLLVSSVLDGSGAPGHIYDLIESRAEGNPLFIEETLRALLDLGALTEADGRLHWNPEADAERLALLIGLSGSVQALMTTRIDQLEPDVRRSLQLASVIGRSFDKQVLEHIAERTSPVLDEHLKRLAQADLVRPVTGGEHQEFAFRHALIRDAAYDSILLRQRRRYHRRVGEAIEALHPERLEDEAPRLAHHFAESRDWARAARYYALAGDAAARLYANAEAIEHYDHAWEICRQNPTVLDDRELITFMRQRGRAFEGAERLDEARANYVELEQIGLARGDVAIQAEAVALQLMLPAAAAGPERDALRDKLRRLIDRLAAQDRQTMLARADVQAVLAGD